MASLMVRTLFYREYNRCLILEVILSKLASILELGLKIASYRLEVLCTGLLHLNLHGSILWIGVVK